MFLFSRLIFLNTFLQQIQIQNFTWSMRNKQKCQYWKSGWHKLRYFDAVSSNISIRLSLFCKFYIHVYIYIYARGLYRNNGKKIFGPKGKKMTEGWKKLQNLGLH